MLSSCSRGGRQKPCRKTVRKVYVDLTNWLRSNHTVHTHSARISKRVTTYRTTATNQARSAYSFDRVPDQRTHTICWYSCFVCVCARVCIYRDTEISRMHFICMKNPRLHRSTVRDGKRRRRIWTEGGRKGNSALFLIKLRLTQWILYTHWDNLIIAAG